MTKAEQAGPQHLSPQRRQDIIDALRRGTVPQSGLAALAVGLERFNDSFANELDTVSAGSAQFKAIRGEYGSGKTFTIRWLREKALQRNFACSEVQISETETPLHRLETVYRRLMERLGISSMSTGAFRDIVQAWFYALEEDVLAGGDVDENDTEALLTATTRLMEQRLTHVFTHSPLFAQALRGYREAVIENRDDIADGLLAWMSGQPNVAASIKRHADLKGDIDHFGALSFLQGVLAILKDAGHPGLLLVLDEVETLQRMRSDVRDKSLNAIRQLMDEIDGGRFPGLYLVLTGTPPFFDGPMGVQRLPPLAQRLAVDFNVEARFDNPRAVQIRLPGFTLDLLSEVGARVRDIYAEGVADKPQFLTRVDNKYITQLATAVTGKLGGKVGVAPRIFLKKLVDVLDRVDQFEDFDPYVNYPLTVNDSELTIAERESAGAAGVDDIKLDL